MRDLADSIAGILHDYHAYNDFDFTADHVIKWVEQFDAGDQQFILEEFLHLLQQGIYVSEDKGRELLMKSINELARFYKLTPINFIKNLKVLSLQKAGKSQATLISIFYEEIEKNFGLKESDCGSVSDKYALYLDDVVASGQTVFTDFGGIWDKETKTYKGGWLEETNEDGESNFDTVISKKVIVIVNAFCIHNWQMIDYRLKMRFNGDDAIQKKIRYWHNYEIQNHRGFPNQNYNFAFPIVSVKGEEYFNSIPATLKAEGAFRKENLPPIERFFSNAVNRQRFENIILYKGIELLAKAQKLQINHRPLGVTTPSHKTMGTGTLFFTWRNVSNTTPIVFWWAAGNWYPLFELINRGKH